MHVICKQNFAFWKQNRGEMLRDELINYSFHH